MLRKVGLASALLLAIPALASAWTVTAKIGSGVGTVTSGLKTIAKPGTYIGYYKVDNTPVLVQSQEFAIAPDAAYSVASVILNGADVTSSLAGGKLTVQAGSPIKNSQSLVVYFKQNLGTIDITQVTGGKITLQRLDDHDNPIGSMTMSDMPNVKPGTKVRVTAMPNSDYVVSGLNGATLPTLYAGDSFSQDVTAIAGKLTVPVSFTQVAVVKPNLAVSNTYINPGESVTVTASAISNMAGVTYAVTSNAADAVVTGTGTSFSVKFPTAGLYDLTVTATVNGSAFAVTKAKLVKVEAHNACTTCHTPRNGYNVASAWQAGAHGIVGDHLTGTCQRCHASQGAIAGFAAGFTGGYALLTDPGAALAWNSVKPATSTDGNITCTVCHMDTHAALRPVNTYDTAALAPVTWDPNANGKLDQYDLCTACHTLTNNAGNVVGNYHDGGSANVERTITDSHYDDPATTTVVEGYNLRKKASTTCADCHNLHAADVAIQEEWAESGHAGKILANKEAALIANAALYYSAPEGTDVTTVLRPGSTRTYLEDYKKTIVNAVNGTLSANALLKTIGATEATGAAWVHYNWDQTSSRGTCQKCHTATGAANYMTAPATYDANKNDFSHLNGWTAAAGSGQNELLYCWGCHTSAATGALRNPGPVKADYNYKGAVATYPDVQGSNTCLSCHIGQASGDSITALSAAGNDFTNVSFINSHYMAAGSLMYVKGGYTNFVPATTAAGTVSYGQSLTSEADQTVTTAGVATAGSLTSTHRKLGTAAIHGDSHNPTFFVEGNLDSDGPCVTCHYAKGDVTKGDNGVADHTLEFGTKTVNGVCIKCHASEAFDAPSLELFVEEQAEPFQETLTLALNLLATNYKITYNQSAYPYFYDTAAANGAVKNWTRSNVTGFTALSAADAEKLMGACFNINLLKRDPAAYAHARTYARRLLFDTIDFLDDGQMNQSAAATAAASGQKDALGNLVYVKGATSNDPLTTEGYKYLAGYDRKTYVWNTWVRP